MNAMNPIEAKPAGRSIMATCAKPAHKAIARMVGYALTLGDADGYADLTDVLALRLSPGERTGLAYAALRSLDHGTACTIADAALGVT